MPHFVKCLLQINEDMGKILLVLQVFLAKKSDIKGLFYGASSNIRNRAYSSAMTLSASALISSR